MNPSGAVVTIESMVQQPLEDVLDIRTGVERWVIDLRARLVDAGYDEGLIDHAITSSLTRFRSSRLREFVPLLVERSVQRDLRHA